MKKLVSGMLVDTAITVAVLVDVTTTIKKTVIDPTEEKEGMIEENRKKAMRKRIARQKIAVTLG